MRSPQTRRISQVTVSRTHVLSPQLNHYDHVIMTVVVERAEKTAEHITPVVIPTNHRIYAILRTA
jgi:hypothetical protein